MRFLQVHTVCAQLGWAPWLSSFPFAGRTVDFGTLGVLILLVVLRVRLKIAALLERSTEQEERHYVTLSKIDALLAGTARQQTFMKYNERYF